jgi:hypothetical protein
MNVLLDGGQQITAMSLCVAGVASASELSGLCLGPISFAPCEGVVPAMPMGAPTPTF